MFNKWKRSPAKRMTNRIKIKPPVPKTDRQGIAVVLIVKNAQLYIEEWIAFHEATGVNQFIIYDNLSTDSTVEILQNIATSSEIITIPWQLQAEDYKTGVILHRQEIAYCHAISTFGSAFRWMAFIDIDEFIVPKSKTTLTEVLGGLEQYSNISMAWLMFGHNGHNDRPDGLVVDNFTQRTNNPTPEGPKILNFKCIVDPTKVTCVRVHQFETSDMGKYTVNVDGLKVQNSDRATMEFIYTKTAQLNHYYSLSKQELEERIIAGGVSGTKGNSFDTIVRQRAEAIDRDTIEDLSALTYWENHVRTNLP